MKTHLTIVGGLHIAQGLLLLAVSALIFLVLCGGGLISGDRMAIMITGLISFVASFFLLIFAIPSIIGGVGLIQGRPWARILILVISCLNLLNIPVGTALGIYSIWVLIQPETERLIAGRVA